MATPLDFAVLLRDDYPKQIAHGLLTMLELTAVSWLLSMVIGIGLAAVRMSRSRWGQHGVALYVEYHQNVPMLAQIFLWYFGIPSLLPMATQQWINGHNSEFVFSAIAIGLCMAAYVSEDLRSGIRAIPNSQLEASRALGLNYLQATRFVVLPQAIRIAMPALVSHTVLLFKNTSLAMAIGVAELTYVTREIESSSFHTVEVYLFATAAYLAISVLIMFCGARLEQRLRVATR